MPASLTVEDKTARIVRASGAAVAVLVVIAAGWMIARDYRFALDNAELHLKNFAVVVGEHTRLALRTADPGIVRAVSQSPATQGDSARASSPSAQAFFAELFGALELAYE